MFYYHYFMNKVKLLSFLLGAISFTMVSCEEKEVLEPASKELEISLTEPAAVSEIYTAKMPKIPVISNETVSTTTGWEKVTRDDLGKLRLGTGTFLTESLAKDRYHSRISLDGRTWPRNKVQLVSVNGTLLGSGHSVNPSTHMGWVAERRFEASKASGSTSSSYVAWRPVSGYSARVETNYTNSTQNLGDFVLFSTVRTKTSDWSVSATAGITVGGSIGVPFVTEGTVEVSLSATAGTGGSKSTSYTENYRTPNINVGPGKSVRFVLEERWRPASGVWHVPLKFRGMIGGRFSDRVHGHNIWGFAASSYFWDFQNGSKKYTVNVSERAFHEFRVAAYLL